MTPSPCPDSPSDKARRQIDLEVQRLEDSIRLLRSRRNLLSPIARLPPELLCKIFSFCASQCAGAINPLEWVRVTHVSRSWRAVALECPSLWSTLVFSRSKWCEEMLKRSKMASLIINADLTCPTPKIITALRLALVHAPRIHELQLLGPSATIERLLADTSFEAPRLRSLSLAVPRYTRFGTDEGMTIPENTLRGEMPYLTRLELTKCNLSWDSSLLNGLTHLKIHDLSVESRPMTEQLIAALERMPGLQVLDLQGALPRMEALPPSLPDRVVDLAQLAQIIIKASVPECVDLINHITIPSNAHVHLSCSGTETTGSDFSGILKLLSSHSRSPTGILDKRAIRALHIHHDTPQTLVVRAWAKPPEESHTGADIKLDLSCHSSSSPAVDVVTMGICKAVQIAHLRSLHLSYVSGMDQQKWIEMFGSLQKLHSVHVVGSSAYSFIAALTEARPSPTPVLSETPLTSCQSPKRPVLRRGKSSASPVYFSALKTLTLKEVKFRGVVPASDPFEDLKNCLMRRSERKADIQELRIRECSYLEEGDVDLLREMVADLDWDEVEMGFTDEEEEEEEEEDAYGAYVYDDEGYGLDDYDDLNFGFELAFPF